MHTVNTDQNTAGCLQLGDELQRRGYKAVIARGYSACLDTIKEDFSEDNVGW